MEIARLEVSTQHHLDRMQETAKVNYVQYGKSTKGKKVRSPHSLGQAATGMIGAMEQVLNPVERLRSFHSHKRLATDVGKADTKRYRTAKLWTWWAEDVGRKDTLRRSVSRGNIPRTH